MPAEQRKKCVEHDLYKKVLNLIYIVRVECDRT